MRRLVPVIAALLILAACGGGDDEPNVAGTDEPGARESATAQTDAPGDPEAEGGDCTDVKDGPGDLEMQDFVFAPRCIEISATQGLDVHNEGDNEHNLTVEALGLDVDVSSGDSSMLEATRFQPGTFTFFCKYHRESNHMEGKLVVASR